MLGCRRKWWKDQLSWCCPSVGENGCQLMVSVPIEEEEGRSWARNHVRSYGKLLLGFFEAKRTILHSELCQGVAEKVIAGWVACGDDTIADELSTHLKGESCWVVIWSSWKLPEIRMFLVAFEILRTSSESSSEMMMIDVESVKRELDFTKNGEETMMFEAEKRLSVSGNRPIPRVQRCAEKVERGISSVSTSIRAMKTMDRRGKSM